MWYGVASCYGQILKNLSVYFKKYWVIIRHTFYLLSTEARYTIIIDSAYPQSVSQYFIPEFHILQIQDNLNIRKLFNTEKKNHNWVSKIFKEFSLLFLGEFWLSEIWAWTGLGKNTRRSCNNEHFGRDHTHMPLFWLFCLCWIQISLYFQDVRFSHCLLVCNCVHSLL